MTETVVAEGQIKFRDGKKWKTRFVVLQKPSPVAVHRFGVAVEPGTQLESGAACLHLCNGLLVLARGLPPAVSGHWKLSALRRYGAVPNGFVFEGGTRCGAWAGVFVLSCSEGEQISLLFDCIVRGVAPSRAQRGLRPPLTESNSDPALTEERISREASDLEKRLSRLSHCSLASSTASTYSCSTSVAGDDRSSISSSSSSHSDTSHTARLPFWVDPLARSRISCDTASSSSTLKPLTCSDDQLYAPGGPETRPSSAHIHARGLHDSGRQSSLDSGIGIATGSQSSYSGSVSSCTGSLDMASQGAGEELISTATLATPTPSATSVPPPSSPPPPPLPPPLPFKPEPSPATSSCTYASKQSTCSSRRHSDEYQIPNLLRLWYDTPRSLLQPKAQEGQSEHGRNSWCNGGGGRSQERGSSDSLGGLSGQHQAVMQRPLSWDSEREPSVDGERSSTPRAGLDYGKTQCTHELDNYVTPEQLQLAKGRASSGAAPGASEAGEDSGAAGRKLWALKRLLSSRPPSAPPPLPVLRPTPACGVFQLPLDSRLHTGGSVNYVNVPNSTLLAKAPHRELLTELELQEPSSAPALRVHAAVAGEGSSRYAHLNVAAMETAGRVGAEHAQGREDRLTQLESRRRGPPH
ncbi:protein Dok-7 isoform X2 [Betta splendens]|uniref:Protein Dok-7 isoform X2 n=1 Tax=Betta splendens TaxID=158456 RepID=A0A9W2XVY3_BETSP|nr:protein Dok-7 isoform X2 [Betta splendens]